MQTDYTHISIVLDRSGSMTNVAADTIGGFNSFIDAQRALPGKCTVSLAQFDSLYESLATFAPLAQLRPLTRETFQPRGATALLDAIGTMITATGAALAAMPESQRPAKVVVVILTDGEENASQTHTLAGIHKMIDEQRTKYSWEFVFIGANQDAIKTGATFGISGHNSMSYAANAQGTRSAFASVAQNLSEYRSGYATSMSFKDDDRKQQKDAGAQSA